MGLLTCKDCDYDIDYAIALSLSEAPPERAPQKRSSATYDDDYRLAQQLQDEDVARQLNQAYRGGNESAQQREQLRKDEELAKQLQEKSESPPSKLPGLFQSLGKFIAPSPPENILCSHCLRPISSSERRVRISQGVEYHSTCFLCSICHLPITGAYSFDSATQLPRHSTCNGHHSQPNACIICGKTFRPGETFLRSGTFPDRGGFCTVHADTTPYCYVCKTYEPSIPGKEKFQALSDGRKQCTDCLSCGIYDSTEAAALYQQVLAFFVSQLQFRLPERMHQVPILCVDATALQENNNCGTCHTGTSVRGLTLSTYQTITYFTAGVRHIFAPTALQHTDRDVTAVLVLYGMPRHLAMSVMAHEAMHVYLRLNPAIPLHLPSEVEEGLCQLIAHMYLQHIRRTEPSSEATPWERQLLPYFMQEIETDQSAVYGDGFRAAKRCCDQIGLDMLLEYVRDHAAFPL